MIIQQQYDELKGEIYSFQQLDEKLIASKLLSNTNIRHGDIGYLFSLQDIVMEEKKCTKAIEQLIRQYWQSGNLFSLLDLEVIEMDIDYFHARIDQYMSVAANIERLIQYVKKNNRMTYQQFLQIVFEKEMAVPTIHIQLVEIIAFSLKGRMIMHPIFIENEKVDQMLLVKKMCSILLQCPIEDIDHISPFMQHYKMYLQKYYTSNRTALIIHQHVEQLDYENKKSFELKQLHLFNIINHFSSGRRSLKRLHKCIDYFQQQFEQGKYGITYKEQTLFYYLLFMRAIKLQLNDEKVNYAKVLLENDRIIFHAVEIFFEFGEALALSRPEPESIIKQYPNYYIEHVFYWILQTFVEQNMYEESYKILQQFELASCTSIYDCLQQEVSEELLAKIEVTFQHDICHVMNVPPQKMMEAIAQWRETYDQTKHAHYETVRYSVKHIMNILKTLFVVGQFDVFEKIFELYKKYMEIPMYSKQLHSFLIAVVDENSSQIVVK